MADNLEVIKQKTSVGHNQCKVCHRENTTELILKEATVPVVTSRDNCR